MNKEARRLAAARYAKFVEWSHQDACFVGRCPELFDGVVHGADEAKVYRQVCKAAEEWVALLHDDKPSGRA